MLGSPLRHERENRIQTPAVLRQRILDLGRPLWIYRAANNVIALQFAQLLRQDFLGGPRKQLAQLPEAPRLVTEFIRSRAKLGGVGEVSPVTVAPALANAICAATGRRLRSMPISRHGLQFA